jgi:type IV secretion system protein VirB5
MPTNTDVTNPYLNARREWNERYGSYIARARAWQWAALAALAVALIAVAGVVYLSSQQRLVPYVVEVDKLGQVAAVARAEPLRTPDQRILRAHLARWIANVRSVWVDVAAERAVLKEAYAAVNRRGAAYNALNDHFRAHDPFERAKQETINVEVQSVLPVSDATWRVEWREERRARDGALLETQIWLATLSIVVSPPTDEAAMLINPLGIYVNTFSWSPRL